MNQKTNLSHIRLITNRRPGLEVIDVIEAFTFDLKGIEATDTGNILKYMCRWKMKNGLQDLEKAMWYLQHLMDHVRKLKEDDERTAILYSDGKPISTITEKKANN